MNNLDGHVVTPEFRGKRRQRRARMIVELTAHLIRHDDSLTHREARCLVECARKAMNSISPDLCQDFNARVAPSLERIIIERWPSEQALFATIHETVN